MFVIQSKIERKKIDLRARRAIAKMSPNPNSTFERQQTQNTTQHATTPVEWRQRRQRERTFIDCSDARMSVPDARRTPRLVLSARASTRLLSTRDERRERIFEVIGRLRSQPNLHRRRRHHRHHRRHRRRRRVRLRRRR